VSAVVLTLSTGHERIDAVLRGIVGIWEMAFPGRIRAYYLTGSYSDGTALPTSDIDLSILFRGGFTHEREEAAADELADHCAQISPVELDLVPLAEEIPFPLRAASIKLASQLIYGEDVRERMLLPPPADYVRQAMELTARLLRRLHGTGDGLPFPLDYPDPDGPFYGYDRSDGAALKDLVTTIGLAATAILAFKAGHYAGGKRDCLRLYRACIDDQWTGYLEEVYERCRNQWGYRVPGDREDRQRLRQLCGQALSFENHFLSFYREYCCLTPDPSRLK
jgi:predicted nucleotidyltransferase